MTSPIRASKVLTTVFIGMPRCEAPHDRSDGSVLQRFERADGPTGGLTN